MTRARRLCPPQSVGSVAGLLLVLSAVASGGPVAAQDPPPIGKEAALALDPPPLDFRPPEPRRTEVGPGVSLLFLQDQTLPLVTVIARFKGGFGLFRRDRYAAATALPGLLRSGGTERLPPDSVDVLIETLALQVSFGSGGESMFSSLNALTSDLEPGIDLWKEMLLRPGFDSAAVAVWRGKELESVRRRQDDPRRLAFSEFNRLMYGDHPTGWEMDREDLDPSLLRPSVLRRIHREVFCTDNLILGVTGDLDWEGAQALAEDLLQGWPSCTGPLPSPPQPEIRHDPAVYVIPRGLSQSTVVMAHETGLRQGDTPDYFASRIGNAILGNSGFSSRLMARVRTQEGYAYSVSSLWTAPRNAPGLVGAVTQTRSGTTVASIRLILDTVAEMASVPPTVDEVRHAIDRTVNGFVFNFTNATQIVSRRMLYRALEMPTDWLERYLAGVQQVGPADVQAVFRKHVRPEDMTILIVGDREAFDAGLEDLGPVRIWNVADPRR